MRDDFNSSTRQALERRVGSRCSNPDCDKGTSGPRAGSSLSVNIGVAAHIQAASPGGARYNEYMLSRDRTAGANGIWLCQSCAKLIDNDEQRFPTELLYTWKATAEGRAAIEVKHRTAAPPRTKLASEVAGSARPTLRISLKADYTLGMDVTDLMKIVTDLALRSAEGNPITVEIECSELGTVLGHIDDPIARAKYRTAWNAKAESVAKTLQTLFSERVQLAWAYRLNDTKAQLIVALGVLQLYAAAGRGYGTKLDVWRTSTPQLCASIDLSSDEFANVLNHLGFTSQNDLKLGAGWRAADELPAAIVLGKVLPRILMVIERAKIDLSSSGTDVLDLPTWHIGLG